MEKKSFDVVKYIFVFIFLIALSLFSFGLEESWAAEVYPFNGSVNADAAVIYKENVKNGAKATELAYGTRIKVNRMVKNAINSYCANVYEIEYEGGIGYTCSGLINNVDINTAKTDIAGVETYQNYCNTLKSSGFPESYCPYLYYLHSKHPNWVFRTDMIGNTLEGIANEEVGKVVLQTSNPNYWYSSTPIEGDYYYVKANVIASFLDPRNSLFENQMFQFLDLEATKDIVNDTALNAITGSGHLAGFINDFKVAGATYQINPLHIMARSKQEGANKSTYSAVKGTYTTDNGKTSHQGYSLDGFYNFFNVGSYISGAYTGTVQRGLAYAAGFLEDDRCMSVDQNNKPYYDVGKTYVEKVNNVDVTMTCGELSYQRPWNTKQKAISGGAEFLANSYIKKGQDTLYYQKFNVSSYTGYNKYTHQYMTNLYAPTSESKTIYSAYNKGNLSNSNFTFIIPVYNNMGDIVQPINKSSNNKLSTIKINNVVLPGFDKDVIEYHYNLVTNASSFTVSAVAEDNKATITGIGNVSFDNSGIANLKIVVKAENGALNTYNVIVTRVKPEDNVKAQDIVNKMGVKVNDKIMYGISPGTNVDTLIKSVTANKGTATVVDISNKAKSTGALVTGDKITVKGTSDSLSLTISVRGDIKNDGKISVLDLLKCQKHILGTDKLANEYFYAADTNYDGKINVLDLLKIQKHILGSAYL